MQINNRALRRFPLLKVSRCSAPQEGPETRARCHAVGRFGPRPDGRSIRKATGGTTHKGARETLALDQPSARDQPPVDQRPGLVLGMEGGSEDGCVLYLFL